MLDCDVAEGVPAIHLQDPRGPVIVLVRIFTEPIGVLAFELGSGGMAAAELCRRIVCELSEPLRDRFVDAGVPWTGELAADGVEPHRAPSFVRRRDDAIAAGPEITAAVCTRNRPDDLVHLLESLDAQAYPRLRILVVDNAPSDDRTRQLVQRRESRHPLDYVVESRPGLSWARNCAVREFTGDVLAFVDDDEVCDLHWAAEVARAFVEVPAADAVTGTIAPAELRTETQFWFENYSGVSRSRGFCREVLGPGARAGQSALYPLPPFGAGANMAFHRRGLQLIGGFDTALGAGTLTLAGEDTAAFSLLLVRGGTLVYQPSAITFHRHRSDRRSLEKVMLGYGRGLSAYYMSMIAHHPRCLAELLRLLPRALRDQLHSTGAKRSALSAMPRDLLALNRRGLLQGAFAYPLARLRARRMVATTPRR